jgi:excisionase family DNA binding protein
MVTGEWRDLPLVLTTEQAAAVLQLNRRTVSNMLDRGELQGVKIGKEWRVSRAEVRGLVERRKHPVVRRHRSAHQRQAHLIEEDGIFVITGAPLVDPDEFIQRERERRLDESFGEAAL